jgi:hypothetical protein
MTSPVIDLDKARMGRPSREFTELYRRAAQDQRMELRVWREETAEMVEAILPHLARLEMVARDLGPTAMASVYAIRGAVDSHARRRGVEPKRTA